MTNDQEAKSLTDINAARERLEERAKNIGAHYGEAMLGRFVDDVRVSDLRALLADHARLQNEVSGALPGPVTIDREGSRDEASVGATAALATYDAGLLSDYGGGNVSWWQDYIRAELAYAHDFYEAQLIANWPLTTVACGWVITNVNGDHYRAWQNGGTVWVKDLADATFYARRVDAEAVHLDDDAAWRVVRRPLPDGGEAVHAQAEGGEA